MNSWWRHGDCTRITTRPHHPWPPHILICRAHILLQTLSTPDTSHTNFSPKTSIDTFHATLSTPSLILCAQWCSPSKLSPDETHYGTRNMWLHILGNMYRLIYKIWQFCSYVRYMWTLCEMCIFPRCTFRQNAYSKGSHTKTECIGIQKGNTYST